MNIRIGVAAAALLAPMVVEAGPTLPAGITAVDEGRLLFGCDSVRWNAAVASATSPHEGHTTPPPSRWPLLVGVLMFAGTRGRRGGPGPFGALVAIPGKPLPRVPVTPVPAMFGSVADPSPAPRRLEASNFLFPFRASTIDSVDFWGSH